MKQVIVKIPNGQRSVEVKTKPVRVWTLAQPRPPTENAHLIPVHGRNAFLEDVVHDWNWRNGILRYYSRVCNSKIEDCYLLLEFA